MEKCPFCMSEMKEQEAVCPVCQAKKGYTLETETYFEREDPASEKYAARIAGGIVMFIGTLLGGVAVMDPDIRLLGLAILAAAYGSGFYLIRQLKINVCQLRLPAGKGKKNLDRARVNRRLMAVAYEMAKQGGSQA